MHFPIRALVVESHLELFVIGGGEEGGGVVVVIVRLRKGSEGRRGVRGRVNGEARAGRSRTFIVTY
jgi:hypothetical protein